jgi:hypothetical protein
MFKSTDGGESWSITGNTAYGGDKPWIAIDRTSLPSRGHIYAAWDQWGCCGENTFVRSTDAGLTFDEPVPVPGMPIWGVPAVGPDGAVYLAGQHRLFSDRFIVAKSTTARDPSRPADFDFGAEIDLGGRMVDHAAGSPNPGGLLGQVWVACDHSQGPHHGNVYILCSLASSDTPVFDPLDVLFVRSIDGGLTWSDPVRVNDDPPRASSWQWFAAVDVAPSGRIDVVWNDTRNDLTVTYSELYYTFSTDAGQTWAPNVPVSPPFNHFLGYPNQNKIGDYLDLASDNAGVRVAYAATFNGEQDVYYLRIIAEDCNENGIADADDIANGTSEDCDSNGIPDECESSGHDCNANGVLDTCDIASGTSLDCQPNGEPDECDLAMGVSEDCNENAVLDDCELSGLDCNDDGVLDPCQLEGNDCNDNGTLDACDISSGSSADCQSNGVPDGCELDDNDCNGNGIPDDCELPDHDCNANGLLDTCDIAAATSEDCQPNGVPDECELGDHDCNGNSVPDVCDIDSGLSSDCQPNGVPDDCELNDNDCDGSGVPDDCELSGNDCNGNLSLDVCDIVSSTSADCQGSGVPDECELEDNDCNGTDVPDECELADNDCNANALPDECDIAVGTSADCQGNFKPDECELVGNDCNSNRVPDECELSGHDCNGNGELDECDIATGESTDCQENGVPDECELTGSDCNGNMVIDWCEIATGASADCQNNGIPDECELEGNNCNGNEVPDECELFGNDCNSNATPDDCELAGGDCNGNGTLDVCDLASGLSEDCQSNGIPDECELGSNDCNANGVPDECDLAGRDCNNNGVVDGCELEGNDCNRNTMLDECDIESGRSEDEDGNGVPDSCERPPCIVGESLKLSTGGADASDYVGYAVGISREVAILGSYGDDDSGYDSGSARVLRRDGGSWVEEATLLASDAAAGDRFGRSVGVSADVAVVGAYQDDDLGDKSGSAYVYRFDGMGWTEEAKLVPADGARRDRFGYAVSVSGNVAVIGAYNHVVDGMATGVAYIFRFDGSQWIEEQTLVPAETAAGDRVGDAVSIAGDVVVVGAYGDDERANAAGAAHVFRHNGSAWVQAAKLTASDGREDDWFGRAVAAGSDVVVVGAYHADPKGDRSGAAYVYRAGETGWFEEQKLVASNGAPSDLFGYSVAVSGQTLLVGGPENEGLLDNVGSAYVYGFDGAGWIEQAALAVPGNAAGDQYAYALALFEGTALIGAYYGPDGHGDRSGAAYVVSGLVDCNRNLALDVCDIADGVSTDEDGNGVPDECDTDQIGDFNVDGRLDLVDYRAFLQCAAGPSGVAPASSRPSVDCLRAFDVDLDTDIDLRDFWMLQSEWNPHP